MCQCACLVPIHTEAVGYVRIKRELRGQALGSTSMSGLVSREQMAIPLSERGRCVLKRGIPPGASESEWGG